MTAALAVLSISAVGGLIYSLIVTNRARKGEKRAIKKLGELKLSLQEALTSNEDLVQSVQALENQLQRNQNAREALRERIEDLTTRCAAGLDINELLSELSNLSAKSRDQTN